MENHKDQQQTESVEVARKKKEGELKVSNSGIPLIPPSGHPIRSRDFSRSPGFYRQTSKYQLIYSLSGLILGLACIIGGIILFLGGVTGSTSWTASILGAQSKLTDAAPGVMLFVVGLFIVFITRFRIKRYPDQ